ncbi:uncharacterized protein LOC114667605 [Erpetoichthys calabaricus]|uniref:uncharacterized protein LOC114667605 n=1 Tax=Erpetoichthys calabaricus TaxID=27687 RepID=UPI002234BABF|nr:uncharacterized protein LOC114667605 [Erpetoichthys calabaricus]
MWPFLPCLTVLWSWTPLFHAQTTGAWLAAPHISLDLSAGSPVLEGSTTMLCAAPQNSTGSRFLLYKERTFIDHQEDHRGGLKDVKFILDNLSASNEGNYCCQFQTFVAGQWTSSPFSSYVYLKISAVQPGLGKPSIMVTPPDGAVHMGEKVKIRCTAPKAPKAQAQMTFLLMEGERKKKRVVASQHPSTGASEVTFTVDSTETTYSCMYQVDMPGVGFTNSSSSTRVKITVKPHTRSPQVNVVPSQAGYTTPAEIEAYVSLPGPKGALIAGSFAAATLLAAILALLVILVLMRVKATQKTKKRRRETPLWSSLHTAEAVIGLGSPPGRRW